MKKRRIVGLIAMVVIVLTVMFSGCVDEEYTSEPTTPSTIQPKYVRGDIIAENKTDGERFFTVIFDYDDNTDKYKRSYIFKGNGKWTCLAEPEYENWYDRTLTEKYEPFKIDHVNLSTVMSWEEYRNAPGISIPSLFNLTTDTFYELNTSVYIRNLDGDVAYIWDFGDGRVINERNILLQYNYPGYYNVSLTAINKTGYTLRASSVVNVSPSKRYLTFKDALDAIPAYKRVGKIQSIQILERELPSHYEYYKEDVCDCSDLSAYMEWWLECHGVHAYIVEGNVLSYPNITIENHTYGPAEGGPHSWVEVELEGKTIIVESTRAHIVPDQLVQYYVLYNFS